MASPICSLYQLLLQLAMAALLTTILLYLFLDFFSHKLYYYQKCHFFDDHY